MIDMRVLSRESRVKNILDFRRAEFGLFQRRKDCLEKSHGIRSWREEGPKKAGSRITSSKVKSGPSQGSGSNAKMPRGVHG